MTFGRDTRHNSIYCHCEGWVIFPARGNLQDPFNFYSASSQIDYCRIMSELSFETEVVTDI